MYTLTQTLHSYLSYIVFITLILAIANALAGWLKNRPFNNNDRLFSLTGLAATHLQVLIGILLYFLSPLGLSSFGGEAMKDALLRLYTVEHPFTMILAVVLITVGFAGAKRTDNDRKKFFRIWLFYMIGLILILSRIPWHVWPW